MGLQRVGYELETKQQQQQIFYSKLFLRALENYQVRTIQILIKLCF